MTPALHERLERLLRGLPEWEIENDRRALLRGILRDHDVWDHLRLEGSAAVTAGGLIKICLEHYPDNLCMLLSGLRDHYKADPERRAEIDFLTSQCCRRAARRSATWKGAPYLGLSYFDRQHAPIFFGREAPLKQLVQVLNLEQGRQFCVVLGASGASKSSLVRAGLWARLEAGEIDEIPGSRDWLISVMTPTDDISTGEPMSAFRASLLQAIMEHQSLRDRCDWKAELRQLRGTPIPQLAERILAKAPSETTWLLILDQMEELFGAVPAESAEPFLDSLIAATQPPSRLRVVATLRADFYHRCHAHPPLLRLLNRPGGAFHLGPPDRRSLEQMVSGPLTEVELNSDGGGTQKPWFLDPDLPPTIASDAEQRPGGLALMAFALRELFELCQSSRHLDVAVYHSSEFGGLGGAIARRADATLGSLGPDSRPALHRVFTRLVRISHDEAPTRRRESLSAWKNDASASALIENFRDARLLVTDRDPTGEPVVEVAHEALLREWPHLNAWIEINKEAFQLAEHVRREARIWTPGKGQSCFQRPWDGAHIDEVRRKLEQAGLLDSLLKEHPSIPLLLTPEAEWLLREIEVEETSDFRRWQIGRRLAEIGDPRPGLGVKDGVPDILWRPISGGSVQIEFYGALEVGAFQIAAYPVTVAQFRCFVEAKDGFQSKRWWKDLLRADPEAEWNSSLTNHPVTYVSWWNATAFCRWLTSNLEVEVRLPDEWEWQRAAESECGFAYPWGPDWEPGRANTGESRLNGTTAVGMFPSGNSRQNVSDLAGNVWEWCRNEYKHPERTGPKGIESRVMRGGSWDFNQVFARAGYRGGFRPDDRIKWIGFRVVVLSPIGGAGRGNEGH